MSDLNSLPYFSNSFLVIPHSRVGIREALLPLLHVSVLLFLCVRGQRCRSGRLGLRLHGARLPSAAVAGRTHPAPGPLPPETAAPRAADCPAAQQRQCGHGQDQ